MTDKLDWDRDGRDWPNHAASRFVMASGFRWHVQVMGSGPALLLLHGTGAATHSWREVAPRLAEHFTVVAPDLPGHGFTDTPPSFRMSLPGMARATGDLLRALDMVPAAAAGHSAGAAILARMSLDGQTPEVARIVSLNGAFLPPRGVPGRVFSPIAKLVASVPFATQLFAKRAADGGTIARLVRETGSTLDAHGLAFYQRLGRSPGHVGGALAMMANWDLRPLLDDLARLKPALTLVVGGNDRSIPPRDAAVVAERAPHATIVTLPGLGHLAHEERPAEVAALIAVSSERPNEGAGLA